MNKDCKILAPVGSIDVLKASVFSGADCVYLSGKKFGARDFAENFNYNQLNKAITFCHKHNVQVFVTVNISILESEIIDAIDYIFYLYSHGVDAIIIEDIGLSYLINQLMPNLNLHASTQMTVYDYSFVKWLCDNGFSSANLSREVSIDRIKEITQNLKKYHHDIDIEVFGHGALCYCYSGQCLMSSFLGGRSGNRGLCAQPCRMRYAIEDPYFGKLTDSNYLLSTKDLCTYNDIEKLLEADINCIKIEGRMKQEDYVASAVYSYKQAILNGSLKQEDYLLLNLSFNRGLTGGYIGNNIADNVVGRERSGSQGYPIGRVIRVRNNKITIKFHNKRYPTKIVRGDGIKFEYDDSSSGMYVSKIISQSKNKITISLNKNISVKEDAMVYITYSKYLHDKTKAIINQKNTHKIILDLELSINDKLFLNIKCSCKQFEKSITCTSTTPFQIAENKPLTKEAINKQLKKTKDTNYTINNLKYNDFKNNLFMPLSSLNDVRRNIIEKIDKEIRNSYLPTDEEMEITKNNITDFKNEYYNKTNKNNKSKQTWNVYISSLKQAQLINNYEYIDSVYYDSSFNHKTAKDYFKEISEEIIELNKIVPNKKIVWTLPRLLPDKDIGHVNEILLKFDILNMDISVQTDNIGAASLLNTKRYGNNLNIYNNYSVEKLSKNPRFERLVISNELSYEDIKRLNNTHCQLELIVFGNMELMISKDNYENLIKDYDYEYYYLVDKRNHRFKLLFDCYNHSHIFDYRILNLSSDIEKIKNTSINSLSMDLRHFNKNDTGNILDYFNCLINNKKGNLKLTQNNEFYKCNFEKGVYINK